MRAKTSDVVKRHYSELSMEETDELVAAIADLIVDLLKRKRGSADAAQRGHERAIGRRAIGPTTREGIR